MVDYMRVRFFRILAICFFVVMSVAPALAQAQTQAKDITWTDAAAFPLFGKAAPYTPTRYDRLPASLQGEIREPVWKLGLNSAGLYVRFRSNSTKIAARWNSTTSHHMNHMTLTGSRGLDLYILTDKGWVFAASGRPEKSKSLTEQTLIANMAPQEREYMLYLSLYDGVSSLEIGVDADARIDAPKVDSPRAAKPVVMYGTSVLQGGCANRPGMAHTNIISRRLDRQVINLGFSGNAFLDLPIARLMASVEDPGCFVLDYVPNATPEMIRERGEEFFDIIRSAHPDVPVIFVECHIYDRCQFDQKEQKRIADKNEAQKELFAKLKKRGVKNIWYITADGLVDFGGTVDGCHLTDLGMTRYADKVCPVIKKHSLK
ncbi:MAG: SGNH/GDSL hydrolase family protein [Bacteroidales bacterium]|nr:SGNH/GDSL hydrolase family protein [Bacteroidales bacterium]